MLKTIWNKGIWTLFFQYLKNDIPDIRLIPLDHVTYMKCQIVIYIKSSPHDMILLKLIHKCNIDAWIPAGINVRRDECLKEAKEINVFSYWLCFVIKMFWHETFCHAFFFNLKIIFTIFSSFKNWIVNIILKL